MKFNKSSLFGQSCGLKFLTGTAGAAFCGLSIAFGGTPASEPAAEEPEEPANLVEFSVGGFDVSGNDAAFQRRWGNNGDFYGGIQSFHFEKPGDGYTFELDGHAMFGLDDYEVEMRYEKDDVGFVRGGYREFTTWYDGSGGYLPGAVAGRDFIELYDDDLSLDRGEIWFEAGLRMPDLPEITFGYQHLWRDGEKDSTMWGRSAPAGIGDRAYVPSYYDIDEERDIFRLDVDYTLGNTDLGLGLRYDSASNDNSRVEKRQHIGTNAGNVDRTITQRDVYDSDLFSAHMFSETRFNEQMLLSFGYSFTTMDTDVDGTERVYDVTSSSRDHGYYDMFGGSQLKLHVVNASFWWNPVKDLTIVPSIRAGWEDISSLVYYTETARPTDPELEGVSSGDSDLTEVSEEIEIRYSGLENILLYARGEWKQGEGDRWISEDLDDDPLLRYTDTDVDEAKYVLGANWYPMKGISVSGQYYYKSFDEDFDHRDVGLTPLMSGHSFDTHDMNVRLTWRALPNLTLITRYDYQQTEYENQPFNPVLRGVESGEIKRHILSESVTWNATERFYIQGSFHWITDSTETGYDYSNAGGDEYSPDWDNDYWSTSLSAGYSLTKNSALEAGFYYYGADNYVDNSSASMPYGTIADEYMLTLGYVQQINANMVWNLRYGYYRGDDDASGGYNDYEAHMVSTGLQVRF